MKKASGLIVLLLVALLVATLVAANTPAVFNGADALTPGTKISAQEEVGGALAAENMTALAVIPEARASFNVLSVLVGFLAFAVYTIGKRAISYKATPGAGGDGLLARFT